MAINIKNRAAATQARVTAFIDELAAKHSAEIKAEFAAAQKEQDKRWDKLKKELLPNAAADKLKKARAARTSKKTTSGSGLK